MSTQTNEIEEIKAVKPYAGFFKKASRPYYIFGPCSAESEEQVISTAKAISENFSDVVYRAGLWKPRTRPGNFEGVGEKGLGWLKSVKEQFGFQVCTEVANPKHLELCLKNGIDMVWLGARTTVNPFSVQEIADALKGVDIPVLIKNPIHPELSLWLGAIERIQNSGINDIGLIHRGVHYRNNLPYRNLPYWEFAIELKRLFPEYPLLCDASHICGTPELLPKVAQKAFDLAMDGLMIETHIDPPNALSDVQQQITPDVLEALISSLQFKSSEILNEEFKNELDSLRNKIDVIDEELLEKIALRMHYIKKIGKYKKENNVTIFQLERWNQIIDRVRKLATNLGLSKPFVKKVFDDIHDESISLQRKIGNDKDN
ncbi:MAG: bifunctional 3-deoxy-7-phosphoheptulonate synthase/chorismate mutase type II [Bacteroidia bacterium]|nr:bifunctional 3-deoxy-7-phosphoheptulonate synthase/chorismate mutase type II [Bacteroidia bacterium]